MGSSFWKLGALLGVIGAGFLVLLQAQKSMTTEEAPPEEFGEVAALKELQSDEGADGVAPEQDAQPLLAEAYAPSPEQEEPGDGAEPTPAVEIAESPAASTASDTHEHSAHPFSLFEPPAGNAVPEPTETAAEDTAEDETNPFADLVRSFPDAAEADTEEPHRSPEPTETAAVDEFNPFGDPPSMAEPVVDAPTEDSTVVAAPDEPLLVELAEPEASAGPPAPTDTGGHLQEKPIELTVLPPGDPGPNLVAPPPTENAEPEMPAQPAEPALFEVANDPAEAEGEMIAQVGAEQRAGAADPNPFLVFPGSENPPPQPARQPAENEAPPLPSIEPLGFGRDAPRTAVSDDRVVHPDGTVEMTIKPREQGRSPAEDTLPASGQSPADGFNPFATVPERPQQSEPQPPDSQQPIFPNGRGIQQAGAETSAAPPAQQNQPLTSADFVGVGTISSDTPSTPQQAQLTIEKKAPSNAVLGKDLIYSILVTNIGQSTAKNVVVEDLVPKGSELKGTDPQAQMTQDKKLIWKLGSMGPGAQRTIRIKVVPTGTGQIGSVATVSFEAAVASRTIITAPELRLALSGPQEVRIGEKAPYKFTLTNTGSADATNVYIRSIIPAGFEHPAATRQNGVTDIEYEVGTIPQGRSKEVELTLLAVSAGEFRNHAILAADGNVSVESHQPVNIITSRLMVQRDAPANRFVGSEALFMNTVSNESSQPLQNITVIERVPAGLEFINASDGGYFNAQQRTITWRIDALEPGGARQLQTTVRATQSGELASTVMAADQRGEKAETTSKLAVAGFSSLTVDVNNPGRPIPVGEEVALRLKVRNGGTAAANSVATRVQLPPELKLVSAKGPVKYAPDGQWITFEPISRIDIEAEQTFDIVLSAVGASDDARIVVQLTSNELTRPLSEDESVVIYADGR